MVIMVVHDLHVALNNFWLHHLGNEQLSGRWEVLGSVSNQASLKQNNQREPRAIAGISVLIVRSAGSDEESQ